MIKLKRSSLKTCKAFFPSVAVETLYPSNSKFNLIASSKWLSSSTNNILCLDCMFHVIKCNLKYTTRGLVILNFNSSIVLLKYGSHYKQPQTCTFCFTGCFVPHS